MFAYPCFGVRKSFLAMFVKKERRIALEQQVLWLQKKHLTSSLFLETIVTT